jgi:uncharacterized membrane protein YtjA (UPF0391 family)
MHSPASVKEPHIRKGWLQAGELMSQTILRKEAHMLYTIALVLGVLWLLGLVTGYTAGYYIHILLVVAVVMVLLNLIQGRRSV